MNKPATSPRRNFGTGAGSCFRSTRRAALAVTMITCAAAATLTLAVPGAAITSATRIEKPPPAHVSAVKIDKPPTIQLQRNS